MAGRARCREALILCDRRVFVALVAFHGGMGSEKGKPVEVVLDGLDRDLPAQDRMTLCAVGSVLAPVNVRMAIRAVLADIGKDRLGVALGTVDLLVKATERIFRGIVIEFWNCADRSPACACVAVLAGDGKWTVRTPARLPLGICLAGEGECETNEHEPTADWKHLRNDCPQRL